VLDYRLLTRLWKKLCERVSGPYSQTPPGITPLVSKLQQAGNFIFTIATGLQNML